MAIVGSLFKISFGLSLPCILMGRLINGIATGILLLLYGKALNETIPNSLLPTYSIFSFTFTLLGMVSNGWISYLLPNDDEPKSELMIDNSWKIQYGWTIIA